MPSVKKQQKRLNIKMREILGDAYDFVRGREYTKTASDITYEQLLDNAIGRIEGTDSRSSVRSPILDRIARIKTEVAKAVDIVKSKPPREWVMEGDGSAPEDRANTEE
jgi:hypothetical protein